VQAAFHSYHRTPPLYAQRRRFRPSETGLHFQIVAEINAACVVGRHHEVHQQRGQPAHADGVLEQLFQRQLAEHFGFEAHAEAEADGGGGNHHFAAVDAVAHQDAHAGHGNQAEHQHHRAADNGAGDSGEGAADDGEQPQ